jgi:two-component system chemotaxis sensor kinase CheA
VTIKVELAEFLTAYIAEVDEQLAAATSRLLAIEATSRKGEREPRAVRELFRAMHTVKGLSSMVGVEPIVAIAHRSEAVLRGADRAGGVLAPAAVDLLLRSIRVIEQSVRAVEKSSTAPTPPADLLSALEAFAPEDEAPGQGHAPRLTLDEALECKLDAFERDLLLKGALQGRRALRLDYAPTAARVAQGLNINTVRERVSALAEIIRVLPITVGVTDRLPAGIAFALLILSSRSNDELAAAAGVDHDSIRSIVELDEVHEEPPDLVAPDGGASARVVSVVDEAPRRNLLRVEAARLDDAMDRLAALIVTRSRLARAIAKLTESGADTRDLTQVANENARQLRDLRTSILQVRMVPLSDVLERIPLMLRAVTRSTGRPIQLEVDAAGAELDKAVAEKIFPAIVHLVRNAVDHGIEPPEDRVRVGKFPEGRVRIRCSARSSTRLELTIGDDGRGIDRAAVARKAGTATPDTDSALLELICQPGFSMREQATTTSGRGLGMDIVRGIAVDQLGGELSMQTHLGAGTTFTLQIPLTVAIIEGFVVECARERFVIPLSVVEEILEISPDAIACRPHVRGPTGAGRPLGLIERRGEILPLYSLRAALSLPGRDDGAEKRALVIRRAGEPVGFLIDRVVGQQEAVIRPLLDPLVRVSGVSAATDLGDGRPTIVLDLVALAGQGQRPGPALSAAMAPSLPSPATAHGVLPA